MMLSKVVSRLKRRFQRQDTRNSQPPELRRWSDFVDPFPHVEPGGYTKYYQTHGLLDGAYPVASTAGAKSDDPTRPPIHSPEKRVKPLPVVTSIHIPEHITQPSKSTASISTSSSTLISTSPPPGMDVSISRSTTSSKLHRSSKTTLLGIPESSIDCFGKRRRDGAHSKYVPGSQGISLRRKKRRVLRASAEGDALQPFAMVGTQSCTSSSEGGHLESPTSVTSVTSNSLSTQSHVSTIETLCGDAGRTGTKLDSDHSSSSVGECDRSRSDSRSSFRTARSEFDD